jgi:hypothetical protein
MHPPFGTLSTRLAALAVGAYLVLAGPTTVLAAHPARTASPSPSPVVSAPPSPSAVPSPEAAGAASPVPIPCIDPTPAPSASGNPSLGPSPAASLCPPPPQPRVGLGVGAEQLILEPDQDIGSFAIGNGGELPMAVTISAFDYTLDSDGNRVRSETPVPLGAAPWIVPTQAFFILQPDEKRVIRFSALRPEDASPGDHYAGVQVHGMITDAAFDELMARRQSRFRVRSSVEFPLTTIVRIPGEVVPQVAIPPFDAFLPGLVLTGDGAFTFMPKIVNQGNVAAMWAPVDGPNQTLEAIVPTLKLRSTGGLFANDATLFDGTLTPDGTAALTALVVMPGTTYTQRLALTDAPLLGSYDYTYTLPASQNDGRPIVTQTGHFTIINVQKVINWIVIPLVVIAGAVTLLVMLRQQSLKRRRVAAVARAHELQRARQEAYELGVREQQVQGRGPW